MNAWYAGVAVVGIGASGYMLASAYSDLRATTVVDVLPRVRLVAASSLRTALLLFATLGTNVFIVEPDHESWLHLIVAIGLTAVAINKAILVRALRSRRE